MKNQLKVIEVKKKVIDLEQFVRRSALESDYDTLIKEPCMLVENGEIKVIYDHFGEDTSGVVKVLNSIKYHVGKRVRGLKSTSRIFGFKPRQQMRQDFCSSTSLSMEFPAEHQAICDLALKLEGYYKKYNPEGYQKHLDMTQSKVKNDWKINNKSLFTSGIINKNNPLKYHFDAGNFVDVYSMMIVFKGGVSGGYLSLPEYGLAFELPNNSIFMFDGQGILHGVTPIKKNHPNSYRYSIVYYTLKAMWKCLEVSEELVRIRKAKTERERIRMENPLTQGDRDMKKKKHAELAGRKGTQ